MYVGAFESEGHAAVWAEWIREHDPNYHRIKVVEGRGLPTQFWIEATRKGAPITWVIKSPNAYMSYLMDQEWGGLITHICVESIKPKIKALG